MADAYLRVMIVNYASVYRELQVTTMDEVPVGHFLCEKGTPDDKPEMLVATHPPNTSPWTLPLNRVAIYGLVTSKPVRITNPDPANILIYTAGGKDPWPPTPPIKPSYYADISQQDYETRYTNFLMSAARGSEVVAGDITAAPVEITVALKTRPTRALLIAVPDQKEGAKHLASAAPAIEMMADFLRARFTDDLMVEKLVGANARAEDVRAAVERIRRSLVSEADVRNALVLVAFVGHGIARCECKKYESWALAAGTELADHELAELFAPFYASDLVVISDCCFGGGVFDTASTDERHTQETLKRKLREMADANVAKVMTAVEKAGQRQRPLLCIAAAGAEGWVLESVQNELIEDTIRAAYHGATYRDLNDWFKQRAFVGREFQVLAAPSGRLDSKVLGPFKVG